MKKELLIYHTQEGKEPYTEWLNSLNDRMLRHRIKTREDRIERGNYGDHKRFHGIIELRLDFGKGYRIYCGEEENRIVILLTGGDKSSQDKDIQKAQEYWRDYHEQKKI